eukprot:UN24858
MSRAVSLILIKINFSFIQNELSCKLPDFQPYRKSIINSSHSHTQKYFVQNTFMNRSKNVIYSLN